MKDGSFKDYVLDQLRRLGRVEARAMFGGYGLYRSGLFFGIVHGGRLYFKTDRAGREEYRRRGMGPFRPNEKQTLKSYYEVPLEVLEDDEELSGWAERACQTTAAGPSLDPQPQPTRFAPPGQNER